MKLLNSIKKAESKFRFWLTQIPPILKFVQAYFSVAIVLGGTMFFLPKDLNSNAMPINLLIYMSVSLSLMMYTALSEPITDKINRKKLNSFKIKDKIIYATLLKNNSSQSFDDNTFFSFLKNNVFEHIDDTIQFNENMENNIVSIYKSEIIVKGMDKDNLSGPYISKFDVNKKEYSLNNYNDLLEWYSENMKNKKFKLFNSLEVSDDLKFLKDNIALINKSEDINSIKENKELLSVCTKIKEFLINNAIKYINETDQVDIDKVKKHIQNDENMEYLIDNYDKKIYLGKELIKKNNISLYMFLKKLKVH